MCARYSLMTSAQEFMDLFKVVDESFEDRPEIFPTDSVPIVIDAPSHNLERKVMRARWGFRPSWNVPSTKVLINVRSETAAQRPTFKRAFEARRCLMPVTAFYEWDGPRRFAFRRPDRRLFAFAGIYEQDLDGTGHELMCSLMTSAAISPVSLVNDRMPVVLSPQDFDTWLSPCTPISEIGRLCETSAPRLEIQEVDRRRPEIELDSPGFQPEKPQQPGLF
jgi:putative SOS response-associated peptidase YedK